MFVAFVILTFRKIFGSNLFQQLSVMLQITRAFQWRPSMHKLEWCGIGQYWVCVSLGWVATRACCTGGLCVSSLCFLGWTVWRFVRAAWRAFLSGRACLCCWSLGCGLWMMVGSAENFTLCCFWKEVTMTEFIYSIQSKKQDMYLRLVVGISYNFKIDYMYRIWCRVYYEFIYRLIIK